MPARHRVECDGTLVVVVSLKSAVKYLYVTVFVRPNPLPFPVIPYYLGNILLVQPPRLGEELEPISVRR